MVVFGHILIMQSMSPAACDTGPSNRHIIISRSCGPREGGARRGAVVAAACCSGSGSVLASEEEQGCGTSTILGRGGGKAGAEEIRQFPVSGGQVHHLLEWEQVQRG